MKRLHHVSLALIEAHEPVLEGVALIQVVEHVALLCLVSLVLVAAVVRQLLTHVDESLLEVELFVLEKTDMALRVAMLLLILKCSLEDGPLVVQIGDLKLQATNLFDQLSRFCTGELEAYQSSLKLAFSVLDLFDALKDVGFACEALFVAVAESKFCFFDGVVAQLVGGCDVLKRCHDEALP